MTRKEFLHQISIIVFSGVTASLSFMSCSGKKDTSDTADQSKTQLDPCNDLSQLSPEDLEIRENFEYVTQTVKPEERCDNCELWVVPADTGQCGGCQIMKGPIKAEGYCTAWIAQENG